MTQIGIEYQKMKNQKEAFDETARANAASEKIKWSNLDEDRRYHDVQQANARYATDTQAALNRYAANLNAATQRYSIAQNAANSRYASDNALRGTKYSADTNAMKDSLVGSYAIAQRNFGVLPGIVNSLGFLWDTLI